jgi:hypothetical protein
MQTGDVPLGGEYDETLRACKLSNQRGNAGSGAINNLDDSGVRRDFGKSDVPLTECETREYDGAGNKFKNRRNRWRKEAS